MKRKRMLSAALLLALLVGCGSSAAQSSSGGASSQAVSGGKPESGSVSSAVGLKRGEAVSVTGDGGGFQLHSVGFSPDGAGWMLRDRYDAVTDTLRSQLLKTADDGATWSKAGDDSRTLDAVRFADSKEGWAISEEAGDTGTGQVRYAVLHTSDGGTGWSVQWGGGPVTSSSAPELWFGDAKNGFALAGGTLLKTADGGAHWSAVPLGAGNPAPQHMAFADAETGWLTAGQGNTLFVLHTADGGKSWTRQFQKQYEDGPIGSAGIDFLNAEEGWFLTSDLATWEGELYHTADGGAAWQAVGKIKCVRPTPEGLDFVDSQTGWIPLDVGAGPVAGGLSVTRDGGKTFQVLGQSPAPVYDQSQKITSAREVGFVTAQQGWAVGSDLNHGDYLLKTEDGGGTWEQVYPAPEPTEDLSFADAKTGFGLGELSDPGAILKAEDGGKSWTAVASFTGKYVTYRLSFVSASEGWLLAGKIGTADGALSALHTADGGKTWSETGPLPAISSPDCFRFFDPKNGVLADGGNALLYRTSDGGKTWQSSALQIDGNERTQFAFLSPADGWQIANRGNAGTPYKIELGRISADGTLQATAEVEQDASSYAFFFRDARTGMVLAEKPPFRADSRMELLTTADGGKTWDRHPLPTEISGDTLHLLKNQFSMQFADEAHGWILTGHGLMKTDDGGRTWAWN